MIVISVLFLHADGEQIYHDKCASCHQKYIPIDKLRDNFVIFKNKKLKLKGPTLNQLSFRLKQRIGDPRGDKEIHEMEVVAFVKDYVYYPDKQKSICLDEVSQVFETMPAMVTKISEEDLEEVASYIYHLSRQTEILQKPVYISFDEAVIEAKKSNKLIMIKVMSENCPFCKKMDREVFASPVVMNLLDKNFVCVEVDAYGEKLPMGLEVSGTPSFFFINKEAQIIKKIPGSWGKEDFLEILNNIKKGVK